MTTYLKDDRGKNARTIEDKMRFYVIFTSVKDSIKKPESEERQNNTSEFTPPPFHYFKNKCKIWNHIRSYNRMCG